MSALRMGNLSPENFADRVDTHFTNEEIDQLRAAWSQRADLTGPEDWHIFDSPSISITVGRATARVVAILVRANDRRPFNRQVDIDLDDRWKHKATEPSPGASS